MVFLDFLVPILSRIVQDRLSGGRQGDSLSGSELSQKAVALSARANFPKESFVGCNYGIDRWIRLINLCTIRVYS